MTPESSWDLKEFADRIRGLDFETFRQRHPDPFLLILKHEQGTATAFRTGKVNVAPAARTPPPGSGASPASSDRLVAIRKSDRNAFRNMISLGRTPNNDIVVDHPSISKLHAFFQVLPDGPAIALTDSSSSNGTTVDGKRLKPHKAAPLESGQSVVFGGAVNTVFLTPEGLHEHIRSLLFFKKL
jgi:hypothetical protein